VFPKLLCQELMQRLHYEHSSVVSSLSQARECIYWPGMSSENQQFIETCDICRAYNRQPKEMLISHEVPERPWAKVGIDLFGYRSHTYLILVAYDQALVLINSRLSVNLRIYMHIYAHIYAYMCTYIFVYVCVLTYVYTQNTFI